MTVRTVSSKQLSMLIADEVFCGHGFVPFVGSGMSAPSGILMGQEFGNYLAYSIFRVLGKKPRHDLPRDGWPKYPRDEEVAETREWLMEKFTLLCRDYACEPDIDEDKLVRAVKFSSGSNITSRHLWSTRRPLIPLMIRSGKDETWERENQTRKFQEQFRTNDEWGLGAETGAFSRTSEQFVVESGLRSMHDWRSMLQFLSRVRFVDKRLTLSEISNNSVIDSFNVHITRDRQINLGQKMLAHLSGPLRIRTVLTTNFDNLIEAAFQKLLRPLSVLSVGNRSELPDPATVRSKNTIVKLHGELTDTRSDFTLDDEPKPQEKETFARYVRGEFDMSKQTDPLANHMLVLGFSGQDVRIIQMMKYTLDTRPAIKIFWICHGTHEPERIQRLFGKEYESRVLIHQTERPDLFLYELYQSVTLNLPSGGFSYEFTHKVPPEKVRNYEDQDFLAQQLIKSGRTYSDAAGFGMPDFLSDRKSLRNKIAQNVGDRIFENIHQSQGGRDHTLRERLPKKNPIAEIHTAWIPNERALKPQSLVKMKLFFTSGSATAMRLAFRKLLSKQYHCLWLELQDYPTPEGLLQDVLRILSLRVGSYQLEHVVLFPGKNVDLFSHLKRLLKFLDISSGTWVFFFYGRSIPGTASSWKNCPWNSQQINEFEKILKTLCRAGFHCVYAPITKDRFEKEKTKTKATDETVLSEISLPVGKSTSRFFVDAYDRAIKKRADVSKDQNKLIDTLLSNEDTEPQLTEAKHLGIYQSLQDLLMEHWIKPTASEYQPKESSERSLTAMERLVLYYRKLRFLYASTLFRQSRHTSAFFSDAVFPCPHKFNFNGIDNDWERSIEVKKWVDQLGSIDVFFYKPGGYSWKYRDMRLGLQLKIEAIPFAKINDSIRKQIFGNDRLEEFTALSYALQIRSRSHFEIASWYWRAFNATGHYLPFIETLYHYFECLDNIDLARPISIPFAETRSDETKNERDVEGYKVTLARDAMLSMIKCLKTGKPWVKFWLSGVNGHEMFESRALGQWLEEKSDAILEPRNEKIKNWQNELKMAGTMLKAELATVQSSLRSEAGQYDPKPHSTISMPDSRFDRFAREFDKMSAELGVNPKLLNLNIASDTQVWREEFDSTFKEWLNHELLHLGHPKGSKPIGEISECLDELFKEDFGQAQANIVNRRIRKLRAVWVKQNLQKAKPYGNGTENEWGFDNSAAIFLVDLISDYAYLVIKRAKMEAAAGFKNEAEAIDGRKRWVQTTVFCSLGLALCRHLHPAYLQRERKQQIKLQTLYGLALANLGRPLEANRRFNEASAVLSKETRTPDEVETAIIRIRRGESSLIRSELIGDVIDSLPQASFAAGLEVLEEDKAQAAREGFDKFLEKAQSLGSGVMDAETADHILDALQEGLYEKRKLKYFFCSPVESTNYDENFVLADPILRKVIDNWRVECRGQQVKDCLQSLFVDLSRMQSSMLDDAWVYIESAERLLAGYSQSSLWWGRVAALKLKAYALVRSDAKFESLVFRRRIQHDNKVSKLHRQLLLISPSGAYQKMKGVKLAADAIISISSQGFVPGSSFTRRSWSVLFGTLHESVSSLLKMYCQEYNKSEDEQPEFPELLLSCLRRAEVAARKSFQSFFHCELDSDMRELSDILPATNSEDFPELNSYLDYCWQNRDPEYVDPNFSAVEELTQRMDLFSRLEQELDGAE